MKKIICVDVDGVLADYYEGWKGVDHFGRPLSKGRELLERLKTKYHVVIYTTRCNPEINKPESAHLLARRVRRWLDENDLLYDEIHTGVGKPLASYYIDDKAIVIDQLEDETYELACEKLGV